MRTDATQDETGRGDQSRRPAPDARPPRAWAVLTGLALSLFLCFLSVRGLMLNNVAELTVDYCMAGAMLFMSVLALAVNPLLKLADRRLFGRRVLAFTSGELALIFLMLALVSGLACYGFAQHVLPIVTGAAYYADGANHWASLIGPHTPSWLVVSDPHTARCFYEGVPPGVPAPWRAWVVPLAAWSLFGLACFAVYVSLMVIMRQQWMENERLAYPIAQVPLELAGAGDDALWPRVARGWRMWIGAAVPFAVTSYNCLASVWPVLAPVNLRGRLPLFGGASGLDLHFSFIVLGFSYLLNTQVSLSLWLFHVLYAVQAGGYKFAGFSLGGNDPFSHLDPAASHQATGGMIVFVAASLWMSRRHLRRVLRAALRPEPALEDPAAVMSYRWAVAAFVLGLAAMLGWLVLCGMRLPVAVAFLALALATVYFLARAVAQAGLAAARPVMIPQAVLVHAIGPTTLTPSEMTALSYNFVWSADVRTSVMSSAANGLRVVADWPPAAAAGRPWRRTLLAAMLLAILGGLAVSCATGILLGYEHGAINSRQAWLTRHLPSYQLAYAASLMRSGPEAIGGRWLFTAAGGGAMAALMFAWNRLPWWPLHPVGFVLGASAPVQWSWTGIFAAWMLKSLTLRYGGARAYRRSRDIAIGLVVGQTLAAGLWILLAWWFGLTNVRAPILR